MRSRAGDTLPIVWQITVCIAALIVVSALVYWFDGCGVEGPTPTCAPGVVKEVHDHVGVDKNDAIVICSTGKTYTLQP